MSTISVIVPVYKVEAYLHRCVESILAQTFTDFELILVDDGSPDNCPEICDEYAEKDNRIHVIHQENGGLSAARNAAIDWVCTNSSSEWISFVDSDDWVHIMYLELLYKAVLRFTSKISQCILYCTEGIVDEKEIQQKMICVTPEEQYSQWYSANACGKLFHKSCFETIRFPVGIIFEDVSIWYKILFSLDKIVIVDEPIYYYYQRSDSIVNSSWTQDKLAQIDAWEKQLEFAKNYGSDTVLQTVLNRYFWVLHNQRKEINACKCIPLREKIKYLTQLKGKEKKLLSDFKILLHKESLYWRFYNQVYPKRSWCYWTIKGLFGKVIRK